MLVLATAAIILLAIVPPTAALAPAKKPNWHINDYWKYHGQFVFIVTVLIDVDLNVTGKGEVSVGPNTYSVFMLDYSIRMKLGTIETTVTGTDYYGRDDFSLIKTRSTTNDNGKLKMTETTYDPPKRVVNFRSLKFTHLGLSPNGIQFLLHRRALATGFPVTCNLSPMAGVYRLRRTGGDR